MMRTLMIAAFALAAVAARAVAAEPDGKALFTRECGICHLPGGTGTFMLGRRLGEANALLETRRNLTAPYVKQVVRYGLNSMPRFTRAELPNGDLEAVTAYLTRAR
ncbi:MAG: cytochrome c [Caulobacteraceae bacterium]